MSRRQGSLLPCVSYCEVVQRQVSTSSSRRKCMLFPVNADDNEEQTFTSCYSAVHRAVYPSTGNLYRPYENINTSNSEEWPHLTNINPNPVLATANAANVAANVLGGYSESTYPWPHIPETAYPNYSHYNATWWNQFYYQQATYDAYTNYDARQVPPPGELFDESNVSSYELEIGSAVSTPKPPSSSCAPTPLMPPQSYPTETIPFPFASYQQYHQPANVYVLPHQQLPIRPVPQQPTNYSIHQCKACFRICTSAGGLKRHAKFCKSSQAYLADIAESMKRKTNNVSEVSEHPTSPEPNVHHNPLTEVNEATTPTQAKSPIIVPLPAGTSPVNLHSPALVIALSSSPSPSSPERSLSASPPSASSPSASIPNASNLATPIDSPSRLPNLREAADEEVVTIDASREQMDSARKSDNGVVQVTIAINNSGTRKKHCRHCKVILPSERALVEHLASHNVEKPYACLTCGGRFSRKFHLTRHIRQRGCGGIPRAEFPCEICGKVFTRKDNLREHAKGHLGQTRPRPKVPCPIPSCGKEFMSRSQLQVHMNYHTGDQPYVCTHESCTKRFRSSSALRKHTRSHNPVKRHDCNQCDAHFATADALADHLKTHLINESGGSFDCQSCLMKFSHEDDLRHHISLFHQQNDEEKYACTLCRRTYRRRWRLQQHYRLEHSDKRLASKKLVLPSKTVESEGTNTKAFYCGICQTAFASKQSLKVHYLTHPPEMPINCPECNKGFERRELLLRHLRFKHRMPTILAVQAMQAVHITNAQQKNVSTEVTQENPLAGDPTSLNGIPAYSLPFQTTVDNADPSVLEANIIELLGVLVDSSALKSFGWPGNSVDFVLRAILQNCGKEPVVNENEPLIERLRSNVKHLFSFIVDDQAALETLFERRPIEQVLEQVIKLAKSNDNNNNIVQLPI